MNDQVKNTTIGLFALLAVALGTWVFLFLNPTIGGGQELKVRFYNIDKINVGTQVTYAGRPIGKVIDIAFVPDAREQAIACEGPIYSYLLTLDVEKDIVLYTSDDLFVHTSGLLGERSVAIVPKPPRLGRTSEPLPKDAVIAANPGSSIEDILSTLERKKFWDNLADTTKSVQEIAKTLNDSKALSSIVTNLHDVSSDLRGITTRFSSKWPTIEQAIDDFASTTEKTKNVATQIASKEGSIGRLLYDDTLYLQMSSLLDKGELLMDDINQYGILFHNNKRWQRARAHRYNEKLWNSQMSVPCSDDPIPACTQD